MKRLVHAAVLSALAATAIAAGPVSAAPAPPLSDYGNTIECRYHANGTGPVFHWRLKKLGVTAPAVYAKSGTQTVGWRFVVTRSMNSGADPWEVTYRSPIEKRSATTTTAAAFTAKSVDVAIPKVDDVTAVQYHVTLKLFWYRANGAVQSQTSYLMPYMEFFQNGQYQGDWARDCTAGYYEGP